MHRGGGEVQVTWKTAGPVRQILAISPAQYQEGKAGVGAAWGATLEGGSGADSLGKVLPRGSAGGTLVWSGDMGAHGGNVSAVRGSACEFIEADNTYVGNAAKGWVLTEGSGRSSATGSGDTDAKDICG